MTHRCGVAHARMKRLTRHEQMVFIFGRDLVNNGMESRGKSKLSLNCAGDGKGVTFQAPLFSVLFVRVLFCASMLAFEFLHPSQITG